LKITKENGRVTTINNNNEIDESCLFIEDFSCNNFLYRSFKYYEINYDLDFIYDEFQYNGLLADFFSSTIIVGNIVTNKTKDIYFFILWKMHFFVNDFEHLTNFEINNMFKGISYKYIVHKFLFVP